MTTTHLACRRKSARKRPWAIAAVAVVIGILAGSSPSRAETLPVTNALPAKTVKIRVMTYNGAYTSMVVHIAKDLGFYAKYHLDADLVVVNSGPAGVAALLGGSLDFIEPPTDQIIENAIRGTDLKIVVGNEDRNFFDLVVADRIKTPHAAQGYPAVMHDLKGRQIGVNALGASVQLMTDALLRGAGMTPDDVTYVADGSSTTALAAWQAGRVDAQMGFTPFPEIVEALGSGHSLIDLAGGQGPAGLQKLGGAFEDFAARGSYIRAHPNIVHAFIKAHEDAIAWIKDKANRARLIQEIGSYVNTAIIPAGKRTQTIELMIDHYNHYLGAGVDRGAIAAWDAYMIQNKLIPHPVDAADVIYSGAPQP